jgi:hypothetical protein
VSIHSLFSKYFLKKIVLLTVILLRVEIKTSYQLRFGVGREKEREREKGRRGEWENVKIWWGVHVSNTVLEIHICVLFQYFYVLR